MVAWSVQKRLMEAFPGSFINRNGEFIAAKRENEYICLENCADEREVQCKVLEYLSRGACKTQRYITDAANMKFHERMRSGINRFLGTNFSHEDMWVIYDWLGNGASRDRTLRFIESGYDVDQLRQLYEEKERKW